MKKHANIPIFVPHAGCPHACSFCNQKHISGVLHMPTPEEVTALLGEAVYKLKGREAQIAFFGGSFTAIGEEVQEALLQAAQPFLGKSGVAGIRLSTRPDCIDEKTLNRLKKYSVTDIELGVQSMDEAVLAANGRGHTPEDVERAVGMIKTRGFSLGLQMMTGLYGSTPEQDRQTAKALGALEPDCVRIYPTLVLEGTRLAELYRAGKYQPQTLQEAVAHCGELLDFFHKRNIPVIRLGLHQEESLAAGLLAGPHHPAFRELCESRLLLEKVLGQIGEKGLPPGPVSIWVNPRSVSKMTGQKKENLAELARLGYPAKIRTRDSLAVYEAAVEASWSI